MIKVKRILSELLDENCYLVTQNNKGILIDPGANTLKIQEECEGVEINYILLTHCHYDHTWSINALRKGRTVLCSSMCMWNIDNPNIALNEREYLPWRNADDAFLDEEVKELDGFKIECIYTPGHTDDSACYRIGNMLFTGDTLMRGCVGRFDLPTGSYRLLNESIQKLYHLPAKTVVYPGHGPKTTIGEEKINGAIKAR